MTPAQFAAAYRSTADQVSAGTGIDPIALLSQWANETSWGTSWAGAPFNLGNIQDGHGHVIAYPSLSAFAQACTATFHNGFYNRVLNATNAIDQLAAIVASPWSAGHYGGSLLGFYTPLEGFELTPEEHGWLSAIFNATTQSFTLQRLTTQLTQVEADLKAAIAAGPKPPPVDLSPALSAISSLKSDVDGQLAAIKSELDAMKPGTDKAIKDLA